MDWVAEEEEDRERGDEDGDGGGDTLIERMWARVEDAITRGIEGIEGSLGWIWELAGMGVDGFGAALVDGGEVEEQGGEDG